MIGKLRNLNGAIIIFNAIVAEIKNFCNNFLIDNSQKTVKSFIESYKFYGKIYKTYKAYKISKKLSKRR